MENDADGTRKMEGKGVDISKEIADKSLAKQNDQLVHKEKIEKLLKTDLIPESNGTIPAALEPIHAKPETQLKHRTRSNI